MRKPIVSILVKLSIALLPMVIAIATNPRPTEYRDHIYRKFCLEQKNKSWDTQTTCNALKFMPKDTRHWTLDQYITHRNYWVFSIYAIHFPALSRSG
jgi:hypothetical protein